jgi:Zn-dependent protease with chaperone function
LAVLSVFGFALASWRGVAALFVTRRLVKSWLRESVPVKLDGFEFPSFSVRHPFPLVAVVGIYRPRLFIAEHLLNTLTPGELDAALRHELGHLATGDNLKRFALRACSDALSIFPCGRSLDKAWAESAECAADEHAAGNQPEVSLELASALVKIARLAVSAGRFSTPVGAYLFGPEEDAGFLAQRVRNLTSPGTARSHLRPDYAVWSGLASLLCLLVFAVSQTSATSAFHSMLEHLAAF